MSEGRLKTPMPLFNHYVIGISVGFSAQPTALAVIEQEVLEDGRYRTKTGAVELRRLDRLPLGASTAKIIGAVKRILDSDSIKKEGDHTTDLIVDITGVGRRILGLMSDEGLNPIAVTITNDTKATEPSHDDWRISMTDLAVGLQDQLDARRLNSPLTKSALDASGLV